MKHEFNDKTMGDAGVKADDHGIQQAVAQTYTSRDLSVVAKEQTVGSAVASEQMAQSNIVGKLELHDPGSGSAISDKLKMRALRGDRHVDDRAGAELLPSTGGPYSLVPPIPVLPIDVENKQQLLGEKYKRHDRAM